MRTCTKCEKKVKAKGLCQKHYTEQRVLNSPPCTVEDCTTGRHTKRVCYKHYIAERAGALLEYKAEEDNDVDKAKTCAWCGKRFYGASVLMRRGTETLHYQQHCYKDYSTAMKEVVALLQQK